MSIEPELTRPPEVQWVKVSGPEVLRPLDRTWIRYLRVTLLAAAVLIAWRILASQEDGYRAAAEDANLLADFGAAAAELGAQTDSTPPAGGSPGTVPVVVISPTPTPTPTPIPTPTLTPTPTPREHRVRQGETLYGIARFYDVPLERLLELNDIVDADDLVPGQALRLPAEAVIPEAPQRPRTYTVQPNDTLSLIAIRFGVRLGDLLAVNNLDNPDTIFIGQTLQIPGGTT